MIWVSESRWVPERTSYTPRILTCRQYLILPPREDNELIHASQTIMPADHKNRLHFVRLPWLDTWPYQTS